MDDALTSEEYEEGEGDSGTSGILTLDGEAWKNRDNTTYNSLLDINGVTDLFSQESTDHYNGRKQESYTEQQELTEYLFLERAETENEADIYSGDILVLESLADKCGMVINMANKGILSKNYYIDPEEVSRFGAEIYSMMAEADQAMAEASEIIAEIASLTERVPNHIRCNELLEACASAQAEIKSVEDIYNEKKQNSYLFIINDAYNRLYDRWVSG